MTTPREHSIHEVQAARPRRDPRPMVPWFPRFFVLEAAAGLLVLAAFAALAMVLDAPLLSIADPSVTPDPSKAPWYFVGLQELLHYYPPVVSGVAVPAAVVLALVVMPYLRPELAHRPVWSEPASGRQVAGLAAGIAALLVGMAITANHVPWVLLLPGAIVGVASIVAGISRRPGPALGWLARRSAVDWIAVWVAVEAVLLTVVGALFRGPGWSWVWPWLEGVY
jgi:quinol-cytochrome oxidoreductase complex cytochrome b subunit